MDANDLLTVNSMVIGTSVVAVCALFGSSRLRTHCLALAASGVIWVLATRFLLPALEASGAEHGVGTDGAVMLLAGFHLLLCVALGLEAMRGNRP